MPHVMHSASFQIKSEQSEAIADRSAQDSKQSTVITYRMEDNSDAEDIGPDHPVASSISAIDKKSVHRICSGQVVLTLGTAVKELLENSIDAGSTIVDIKLKEYGSELVEVSDNGIGVHPSNFEGLTLKHHTSKLRDFGDLINVETFGFRGEALSSLCALCDMSVTTRHQDQSVGTKLEFDHNGRITKQEPQARQVGTKVMLQNLFYTLPVRHKEFQRNLKKEFAKMVQVLNSYCIISTGVRITCSNVTSKGSRSTVVSSQGNALLQENISNVFGPKQVQSLLGFQQRVPNQDVCTEYGLKVDSPSLFKIEGFVSKCEHGLGRSSTDRQFFFINGRPFDSTKLSKVINEVYHQYNRHQYPFVVLKIGVNKDGVDVNVTPDKRQVFVEGEKILLATVKCSLVAMFGSTTSFIQLHQPEIISKLGRSHSEPDQSLTTESCFRMKTESGIPKVNGIVSSLSKLKRSFSSAFAREDSPFSKQKSPSKSSPLSKQRRMDCFINKKDSSPVKDCNLSTTSGHSIKLFQHQECATGSDAQSAIIIDETGDHSANSNERLELHGESVVKINDDDLDLGCSVHQHRDEQRAERTDSELRTQFTITRHSPQKGERMTDSVLDSKACVFVTKDTDESRTYTNKPENRTADNCVSISYHRESTGNAELRDTSNIFECETENMNSVLPVDNMMDPCGEANGDSNVDSNKDLVHKTEKQLKFSLQQFKERWKHKANKKEIADSFCRAFRAKINPTDNQAAEQELQREIKKESFSQMEILGQFNMGFIITKLGEDLFIVDQHATDEKFNFETLQREYVIQSQKLICPLNLELTSSNEIILMDNLEIFRKNGFEFLVDESGLPTQRVKLISTPVSKNWNFGKEDIEEMIFMLTDSPGVMCRPSRVRAMFASRACRKSIMIGTTLNKTEMKKLLCHMGEIEQPWNCPHGRPTMRHLINLDMIPK